MINPFYSSLITEDEQPIEYGTSDLNTILKINTSKIESINTAIELCRIANKTDVVEKLIKLAEIYTNRLQTQLLAQLAFSSPNVTDPEITSEKIHQVNHNLSDAASRAAVALSWMEKCQYDAAQAILDSLDNSNEAIPELCFAKAQLAAYKHDYSLCFQEAKNALVGFKNQAVSNQNQESQSILATHLQKLGKLFLEISTHGFPCKEETLQCFHLSLQLQADNPKTLSLLSQAYLLSKEPELALQYAIIAHALNPEPEIIRSLAQAYEANNDFPSALNYWSKLVAINDASHTEQKEFIKPENIIGYTLCALKAQHPDDVISLLKKVIISDPDNNQYHFYLGKAYLEQYLLYNKQSPQALEEAINIFQNLLQNDPQYQAAWQELAIAYSYLGNPLESLDAARKALGVSPTDIQTILWFCDHVNRIGNPQEAVEVLQWAIKLYPEQPILRLKLAEIYRSQGFIDQTQVVLSDLIREEVLPPTILLNTAQEFLAIHQPALAQKCLEKVHFQNETLDNQNKCLFHYLSSLTHFQNGTLEPAYQEIKKALRENYQFEAGLKLLAEISLQLENLPEAISSLEQLLAKNPYDVEANLQLFEIYRRCGELDKARDKAALISSFTDSYNNSLAEFAYNIFDIHLAHKLLSSSNFLSFSTIHDLRKACLKAELFLEEENYKEAKPIIHALSNALNENNPDFEIPLCTQARILGLSLRWNNQDKNVINKFKQAVAQISTEDNKSLYHPFDLQMIAIASQHLLEVNIAIELMSKVLSSQVYEPRPYLLQALLLLTQAEHQKLCQFLDVTVHASGDQSYSNENQRRFEQLITTANHLAKTVQKDDLFKSLLTANNQLLQDNHSLLEQLSSYPFLPNQKSFQLIKQIIENFNTQPSVSLELSQKLEAFAGQHPLWHALIAKCASKIGNNDLAIQALQLALNEWQDEDRWHIWLYHLYNNKGDIENAKNHIEAAVKLEPENHVYLLELANFYTKNKLNLDEACFILEKIITHEPQNIEVHLLLADTLLANNNSEKAYHVLINAQKYLPFEDEQLKKIVTQKSATAAISAGKIETATQILESLIEKFPNDKSILKQLVNAYVISYQTTNAVQYANKLIQQENRSIEDLFWYIKQMFRLHLPEKAIDVIKEELKHHPNLARLYILLAQAQLLQNKKDEALATLKFANLSLSDQEDELQKAAQEFLDIDEPEAALMCLSKIKRGFFNKSQDNTSNIALLKSKAYQKLGKLDEAWKHLEQASKTENQDNQQILKQTISLYLANNKIAHAEKTLQLLIQQSNHDDEVLYLAMHIYDNKGDLDKARSYIFDLKHAPFSLRLKAAELASQLLEYPLAFELIKEETSDDLYHPANKIKADLLKTELLLDTGCIEDARSTFKHLNSMIVNSEFPLGETEIIRRKAIDARLLGLEDNTDLLRFTIDKKQISKQEFFTICKALWNIESWEEGLTLCEEFISNHTQDVIAHLLYVQGLVLRAEKQRTCERLSVENHAPGAQSILPSSQEKFTSAIHKAKEILLSFANYNDMQLASALDQWWIRGQAVFNEVVYPDNLIQLENIAKYPQHLAAYYAALGRNKAYDILSQGTPNIENFPSDAIFQKALGLLDFSPQESLRLLINHEKQLALLIKEKPLIKYLTAKAAFLCGEISLAQQSIQEALDSWSDEAAWQFLAAQISLYSGDQNKALQHLIIVQKLKPNSPTYTLTFAHTCLEQGKFIDQAILALNQLLLDYNEYPQAHVLLAKAYSMIGNNEESLEHYREAILQFTDENESLIKFAIEEYLQLLHDLKLPFEEAVKPVKNLANRLPQNDYVWKILAEFYSNHQALEDAYFMAEQVIKHSPSKENIIWFARHALNIGKKEIAIQTLKDYIQEYPSDISLHTALVDVYSSLEMQEDVRTTLKNITQIPDLTYKDKLQIAESMLKVHEVDLAIQWLEELRSSLSTANSSEIFQLNLLASKAYQQSGDLDNAIQMADVALSQLPTAVEIVELHKAKIYLDSDEPQKALKSLNHVFELDPQNSEAHFLAMQIYHSSSQIESAFQHLPYAMNHSLAAQIAAAELYYNCLNNDLAIQTLQKDSFTTEDKSISDELYKECLLAELFIQQQKISEAVQRCQRIQYLQQKKYSQIRDDLLTRISALKWRLSAHTDQIQWGQETISWLDIISHNTDRNLLQAIALAALEKNDFYTAIQASTKALSQHPIEPKFHLTYAKAVILCSEFNKIAQELEALAHIVSLGQDDKVIYQSVIQALNHAEEFATPEEIKPMIKSLKTRAEALYNPSCDINESILWCQQVHSPEEAIAFLTFALKTKDFHNAVEIAHKFSNDSRVSSLFALILLENHPIQAEETAIKALENVHSADPWLPLQYAIAAKTAEYVGNDDIAYEYLEKALSLWNNEPRWHQRIAQLALKLGKPTIANKFIEQMLTLQPKLAETQISAAQIYIESLSEPQKAIDILQSLIKTLPEESDQSFLAQALLAEALMQAGNKDDALILYRKVFKSPLAQDPIWKIKISLGLAKAALLSGQASTAIAVLEDIVHIAPRELSIYKLLTEAYIKASLPQSALQTAQLVLSESPANVENLTWYAEKNLELNHPHEALQALKRAIEIHPQDFSIQTLYANTLLNVGQRDQAIEWYQKLLPNENILLEDIINSVETLLQHGETNLALKILQNAQRNKNFYSKDDQRQILINLAKVYQSMGDLQAGIKYIEQALQISSEPISEPYKLKASMYLQLDRPQAALAVLEQALAIDPNDESIETQKLEILKTKGEIEAALEQAQKMAKRSSASRALAAAFSIMMMDDETTKVILDEESLNLDKITPATFLLAVYKAEIALDKGEFNEALWIYNKLKNHTEQDTSLPPTLQARLHTLAARLSRHGVLELPFQTSLEEAYAVVSAEGVDEGHKVALVEAALDCLDFDKAQKILDQLLSSERKEPKPYLLLARCLTQKAEWKRLCNVALVRNHAPSSDSISESAYHSFESAINLAVQRLSGNIYNNAGSSKTLSGIQKENYAHHQIQRWWLRGKAAFDDVPNEETILGLTNLPATAEDTSALISAYARSGKAALTHTLAMDFPKSYEVQAQWLAAINLSDIETDYLQIRKSIEPLLSEKSEHSTPILLALLARVADKAGNKEEAIHLIKEALFQWQNEALWVEFYASKCFECGDIQNGFTALEKYLTINPTDLEIRRTLAKAYFDFQQYNSSISHYQFLAEESLTDIQSRLALAEAFLAQNKLNEAKQWAKEALALDGNNKQALLINAQLALKAQDYVKAYKHAKAALRNDSRDEKIYFTLAAALHALNQPDKALLALDRAIEFAGNVPQAKLEKIKMIRSIQGDEAALPLLFKLSEENPDFSPALAYLAHFLTDLGQYEPALQAAQIALKNDDGLLNENELSELHFLSGKLYHNNGNLDKAIYHFSQAIKLNPHEVEHYIELGKTYQERRQPLQALQTLHQAIQLFPSDARLYYYAALAMKDSKDFKGAEKMLQKAIQLAPNDVRIQRLLGSITALNLVHNR